MGGQREFKNTHVPQVNSRDKIRPIELKKMLELIRDEKSDFYSATMQDYHRLILGFNNLFSPGNDTHHLRSREFAYYHTKYHPQENKCDS